MHRFMSELCLNCNKFSHCNNNDLICISRYKVKEQECEEYKKKFSRFFNIDNQECWDIAFLNNEKAKYKQALDEIENYVRDNSDFDKSDKLTSNTSAYDILEIINEGKE